MNKSKIKSSWFFPASIYFMRTFPLLTQWLRYKLENNRRWMVRKEILDYYKDKSPDDLDDDTKEGLRYIKKKGLELFPFFWADKYSPLKVKVYMDDACGLQYVLHDNKRLYYKRGLNPSDIQLSYTALSIEQDKKSAHCYLTDSFDLDDGSILFDLGAAEGIFALSVIERVEKVYLFESDPEWIEPLRKTFEPWKDKVEIINKYASSQDSDHSITIDTVLKDTEKASLFLKVDVEGAEKDVIRGASKTLDSDRFKVKAAVCTYHYHHDYNELCSLMDSIGYKAEHSKSYMLCFYSKPLVYPFFRRALIYCYK